MIKAILIFCAVIAVVAFLVIYVWSIGWCADNFNMVFKGTIVAKESNAVNTGFGGSENNYCVMQLDPSHYIPFKNMNVTKTYASIDFDVPCQYQVGDKV